MYRRYDQFYSNIIQYSRKLLYNFGTKFSKTCHSGVWALGWSPNFSHVPWYTVHITHMILYYPSEKVFSSILDTFWYTASYFCLPLLVLSCNPRLFYVLPNIWIFPIIKKNLKHLGTYMLCPKTNLLKLHNKKLKSLRTFVTWYSQWLF